MSEPKQDTEADCGRSDSTEVLAIGSELERQTQRAEALAETIRELRDVVTHDAETKAEFIDRVRAVLSADPDERVRMANGIELTGDA